MKCPVFVLTVFCCLPSLVQAGEEVVKFDCNQVELRQINDRWYLCCGRTALKDVGIDERTAREVLDLVRNLGLTQRGTIGKPLPVIEYWLADGKAPQAFTRGLRLMAIQPEHLHVEQLLGQWCVLEGPQVMFGFGPHADDARRALAILKQYGFNRVGYIGMPTPVMMYFLVSDEAAPGAQAPAPDSQESTS
jgi:hypothetical protein